MGFEHKSVLLFETVDGLNIKPDGIYVDGTLGGGGHAYEVASRLGENGSIIGIDQDAAAIKAAGERLKDFGEKVTIVRSNYCEMKSRLQELGIDKVDGIVLDLGVSSYQLDTAERGFTYREDAPLDMRMNRRGGMTAADVVNGYDADTLAQVLKMYGELDTTWKIANCIERARKISEIRTTGELVAAVAPCTPKKEEAKFLTKLFQALRIEVNGEMEALKMALEQSLKVLRPGGRLVVISYHSLEDRLVKNFFKSGNFDGKVEKDFYGHISSPFEVVTRKAVVPTDEELVRNSRSRSAKLRAAIKL